ncbi:hypothetical protein HPB47_016528 [Ixodes persulcatus]|uniref:Uncharacterized protein n=1 Tax=Ixodes persulcatus TaxID=34615 RepID=A0AC60QQQ2_IXOPE|nr:hypothetical protein HPB47_016528 [Ixodes persulcatus]
MNVEDFLTEEIRAMIEKTGVKNMNEFTVHRHDKANTVTNKTKNSLLVENFQQIREISREQQGPQVQPYEALGSNELRGVIYLHSPHDEPETLVSALNCNTRKIIVARALGIKKTTILLTFDGRTLPWRVRYVFEVYRVAEYRPRSLVCFRCHKLSHKAHVCSNNIRRCGSYGQEHGEVEDCAWLQQSAPTATEHTSPQATIAPKGKFPRKATREEAQEKNPPRELTKTSKILCSFWRRGLPCRYRLPRTFHGQIQ